MIAFFSISPVGTGLHLGDAVADAVRIVEESGLDHQVTAMGTILEGDWDEVMGVIQRCMDAMHEHSDRVSCLIKLDDFAGRTGTLSAKVGRVEEALGHAVRR